MRTAETILNIIQDRGQRGLPLDDVYRQLFNPEMYLRAYSRIQKNTGAMTTGTTKETVDGMSQDKIANLIEVIRLERWQWTPVRRVEIPKSNGKTRPLGIPTWSDKLLQEVIRSILEAYYDPQFSEHSHGFRPNRGCHTALNQIHKTWVGTKWFIEGDIKGYFDNIDHTKLMSILREKIQDNRFLRLIEGLLKAGYCEEWKYHPTLSGTPQGGVISPLLANIYLDQMDAYVAEKLIPAYTRGERRKPHPQYTRLSQLGSYYRRRGRPEKAEELRRQAQKLPSGIPNDPDYRRLRYVRYADDFLLGLIGPKAEAEDIKEEVATFLETELQLTLSAEKTLVTHATMERARFLGYEIGIMQSQTKFDDQRRRVINGTVGLYIPNRVIEQKQQAYLRNGKVIHRAELLHYSEYDIICRYQWEYRGLVEYYAMAQNYGRLSGVGWTMEKSLLKTLAHKNRTTMWKTWKRLRAKTDTPQGPRACLKLIIPRMDKKPLVATFGGLPLKRRPTARIKDEDIRLHVNNMRSELLTRLLRDTCEICGSQDNVEVHHIRKLADLKQRGRREKPYWMQIMSALQRKTLVVCRRCHETIHYHWSTSRTKDTGEPDAGKLASPVRRGARGKGA
jgi:group II intron reverse transcriptase/maturase